MRKKLFYIMVYTFILVAGWIIVTEFMPPQGTLMPGIPVWLSEGVIPFLVFSVIIFLGAWFILDKFRLPFNELIMSGFVFISTAYLVLMITGIFFRGPGMELTFFK